MVSSFFTGAGAYLGVSIGLIVNVGSGFLTWTGYGAAVGVAALSLGPSIAVAFYLTFSVLGVSEDFAGSLDSTSLGAGGALTLTLGSSLMTTFGASGTGTGATTTFAGVGNSTLTSSLATSLATSLTTGLTSFLTTSLTPSFLTYYFTGSGF